ncbi:hypothetical protein HDU96_002220 [Phlyctochytrium bullatum]|nr:hypothetical protein HDU96_002220 [Phlyctochytrium bullatum]
MSSDGRSVPPPPTGMRQMGMRPIGSGGGSNRGFKVPSMSSIEASVSSEHTASNPVRKEPASIQSKLPFGKLPAGTPLSVNSTAVLSKPLGFVNSLSASKASRPPPSPSTHTNSSTDEHREPFERTTNAPSTLSPKRNSSGANHTVPVVVLSTTVTEVPARAKRPKTGKEKGFRTSFPLEYDGTDRRSSLKEFQVHLAHHHVPHPSATASVEDDFEIVKANFCLTSFFPEGPIATRRFPMTSNWFAQPTKCTFWVPHFALKKESLLTHPELFAPELSQYFVADSLHTCMLCGGPNHFSQGPCSLKGQEESAARFLELLRTFHDETLYELDLDEGLREACADTVMGRIRFFETELVELGFAARVGAMERQVGVLKEMEEVDHADICGDAVRRPVVVDAKIEAAERRSTSLHSPVREPTPEKVWPEPEDEAEDEANGVPFSSRPVPSINRWGFGASSLNSGKAVHDRPLQDSAHTANTSLRNRSPVRTDEAFGSSFSPCKFLNVSFDTENRDMDRPKASDSYHTGAPQSSQKRKGEMRTGVSRSQARHEEPELPLKRPSYDLAPDSARNKRRAAETHFTRKPLWGGTSVETRPADDPLLKEFGGSGQGRMADGARDGLYGEIGETSTPAKKRGPRTADEEDDSFVVIATPVQENITQFSSPNPGGQGAGSPRPTPFSRFGVSLNAVEVDDIEDPDGPQEPAPRLSALEGRLSFQTGSSAPLRSNVPSMRAGAYRDPNVTKWLEGLAACSQFVDPDLPPYATAAQASET